MTQTVEIIWCKHPFGNWCDNTTDKITGLSNEEANILSERYSKITLVKAVNVTEEQ